MRDRYETLGKNTTYKRSSVREKFFFNCNSSLSCADSETYPCQANKYLFTLRTTSRETTENFVFSVRKASRGRSHGVNDDHGKGSPLDDYLFPEGTPTTQLCCFLLKFF